MKQNITQDAVLYDFKPKDKAYDVYDKKVGGFVARVRPSGTITYLLSYDIAGRTKKYTIGKDGEPVVVKREVDGAVLEEVKELNATIARDKAIGLRYRIREGEDPQTTRKQAAKVKIEERYRTLGTYFEQRYTPFHLRRRSTRGAAEGERIIRRNFGHLFEKALTQLTTDDIEKWENNLATVTVHTVCGTHTLRTE